MAQSDGQRAAEHSRPARLEWAVLVLIVLSCSQLGYVGHPRYGPFIAAADVLCALLAPIWLWRAWRTGRLASAERPPTAVWVWLVVSVLSMSRSALDAEGSFFPAGIKSGVIESVQLGLYFVVAYMMFVYVLNNVPKMRRAAAVLLGATSVSVLWGLVDYLTQPEALAVKAGFGSRNVYSAFMVMVVPLLFGIALHERHRWQRVWVVALIAVAAVTMLGPPHVWVLLVLLCWQAYVRGGRIRGYFIPLAVGYFVAISCALPRNYAANVVELLDPYERGELYKGGDSVISRATGGEEDLPEEPSPPASPPIKKRWLEWQPALMMLCENFPLGVGAGCYQSRIGEYYTSPTNPDVSLPNVKKTEPDTNNLYLVTAGATGFSGLVCLVALLAFFLRRAAFLWLRAGSAVERGLSAGLPAALAGVAAANLFSNLFVRGTSITCALLFAMVTVMGREGVAAERRRAAQPAITDPTR